MAKVNYDNYSVEDFLADESFQQYCREENQEIKSYWEKIIQDIPHQKQTIVAAQNLFKILNGDQGKLEEEKQKLMTRLEEPKEIPVKRLWVNWWAAAIVMIISGAGLWLLMNNKTSDNPLIGAEVNYISPGTTKAYLTLSDGSSVFLDSNQLNVLDSLGRIFISHEKGILTYKPDEGQEAGLYNTLTTPLGGQFQIILPDGSHVWLNAGSSLRYPTSFTAKERRVEITGEVYFDVKHDKAKPFIISNGEVNIEVLGTSLNVQAYKEDDQIKTTLVTGSVRVTTKKESLKIRPGEQVVARRSGGLHLAKDIDVEAVIDWKNGKFIFNGENIQGVMNKLERWYNINTVYEPGLAEEEYVGLISRNASLSEVLKMLETTDAVRFKREGNNITVMPYKK